ncbi:MAG: MBL fold metallo-hydrolase [Candidatus Micrarchaeota archaeon]|nr:MBL fold metallo-hydrolase [Candidatus Micrarchaeota archaeon]MDE1849574.1 MBL fold metallo-hydrolase [Candidatus Micrarchaeota archaeon]
MKLTFYGAAGEVGRSCIMIESDDTRILLDSGVKLGEHDEYPLIDDKELQGIDGVILSHAHLDHSGYLPHIYSAGYMGHVYATKPTFELSTVLISDYMRISNPSNVTKDGLAKLQRHFKQVEYYEDFKIKNLNIRLIPAGHILGSAMIEVWDSRNRLLYTGDVNFRTTKLLDAAPSGHIKVDTLITESTYAGDKEEFQSEKKILDDMVKSINETITRGGKTVVPSFAVGRAQEVLLMLDDYMKSGRLQKVTIYMDGMINKAMRIHRHNVVFCRDELQKRILLNEDDPFKSVNFKDVRTKQERSRIMSSDESSIIVTTSGMLTGGPILRYLERMAADSKNRMVMVGYQAEGTTGRAIFDGAKEIMIKDKKVQIRMDVSMYHLSAHADRVQLMHFIGSMKDLKNIFIVHGEKEKAAQFHAALKGKYNAHLPSLKGTYEI